MEAPEGKVIPEPERCDPALEAECRVDVSTLTYEVPLCFNIMCALVAVLLWQNMLTYYSVQLRPEEEETPLNPQPLQYKNNDLEEDEDDVEDGSDEQGDMAMALFFEALGEIDDESVAAAVAELESGVAVAELESGAAVAELASGAAVADLASAGGELTAEQEEAWLLAEIQKISAQEAEPKDPAPAAAPSSPSVLDAVNLDGARSPATIVGDGAESPATIVGVDSAMPAPVLDVPAESLAEDLEPEVVYVDDSVAPALEVPADCNIDEFVAELIDQGVSSDVIDAIFDSVKPSQLTVAESMNAEEQECATELQTWKPEEPIAQDAADVDENCEEEGAEEEPLEIDPIVEVQPRGNTKKKRQDQDQEEEPVAKKSKAGCASTDKASAKTIASKPKAKAEAKCKAQKEVKTTPAKKGSVSSGSDGAAVENKKEEAKPAAEAETQVKAAVNGKALVRGKAMGKAKAKEKAKASDEPRASAKATAKAKTNAKAVKKG